MKPDYFSIILTSALVAALVSAISAWFNEWRRRVSEEKRFKLDAALRLTQMKYELAKMVYQPGGKGKRPDPLENLLWYRKHIEWLWSGKISSYEDLQEASDSLIP